MKKTLLLAAALACSGVAQAEIYFCSTNGIAFVEAKEWYESRGFASSRSPNAHKKRVILLLTQVKDLEVQQKRILNIKAHATR